jgi:secondary thiamine-phosphate synthase enzyme
LRTIRLPIDTSERWYVDLTDDAREFVGDLGDGLLNVFVPHSTAALAIIELGDGSETDLAQLIDRLLPRDDALYKHHHGAPGHGADHLLPVLLSPSLTLPVQSGGLMLGAWQHIVLVDMNRNNPQREALLSFVEVGPAASSTTR